MSTPRILLVVDEQRLPVQLQTGDCMDALSRSFPDATVEAVTEAARGLEVVDEHVDCVVSGLPLSDGGLSFLRTLRARNRDVPVVYLSPSADECVPLEAVSLDVTTHLCLEDADDPTGELVGAVATALPSAWQESAVLDPEQTDDATVRGTDGGGPRQAQASAGDGRYRRLLENLGDPVYMLDEEGYIEMVNEALLEEGGFERESIVGDHITTVISMDDFERGTEILLELLESDEKDTETFELEIDHADGSSREYEDHVSVVRDADGNYAGSVGIIRDIQERKERERGLEQYEAIIETMPDGVFIFDEDTTIVGGNEQGAALIGVDYEEAVGKRIDQLVADGVFGGEVTDQFVEVLPELLSSNSEKSVATLEFTVNPVDRDEELVCETRLTLRPYENEYRGVIGVIQNITERKERERELEQYEAVVEAVDDLVYAVDDQGEFVFVNQAQESMTGYSREELLGEHISIMMDDRSRSKARQKIAELRSSAQQSVSFERITTTKDGEEVYCEDNMALLPTENDEFRGTAGIVRDITERKERERELEQYETIVQTIPDGVIVVDETNEIVSCNEQTADLFGIPSDELLGTDVMDLVENGVIGDDLIEEGNTVLPKLLSSDSDIEEATFDLTISPRDSDEDRIIRERYTPRPLEDGEYRGTVGVMRDVTERKERERELEQYETLVQAVPDTMFATDEEWNMAFTNEAGLERFGFTEDELEAGEVHMTDTVADRDIEAFENATRRLLESEAGATTKASVNYTAITNDGRRFPAEAHFSLFEVSEDRIAAAGITRDVSVRKQRQERLQVLNRLLRHNLRNDLSAIIGGSDLLADRLIEKCGDEEGANIAQRSYEVATKLAEMSDEIRQIGKALERSGVDTPRIDAVTVTEEVVSDYRDIYPEANIDLNLPDEASVEADDTLEIVIENLVENAIEHNDKETPDIDVGITQRDRDRGDWYELRISDNGPGISEQERVIVEEEAEESALRHASGIGLWAVAWIVHSFDGDVEFQTEGVGSDVVVTLRQAAG